MKYFWDYIPANIALRIICFLGFSTMFAWFSVVSYGSSPTASGIFVGSAVFFGLVSLLISIFATAAVVISEIEKKLPPKKENDRESEITTR